MLSKIRFLFLLAFGFCLGYNSASAQSESELDSLESLLPFANDLQRADILNGIANCIRNSDTTKAGNYVRQAYILSGKLNYCKGRATSSIILGILQKIHGDYLGAQQFYLSGLALALKCKEPYSVAFAYHSLGNLSYIKGNYGRAIRYYIGSVKISEQIGDKNRAARTYNNIGTLYMELKEFDQAEEFYQRSLDLFKGREEELIVAEIENNLANIYLFRNYDLKALYHFSNALEVFRKLSSSADISSALNNIGTVYISRNQPQKALPFFIEAHNLNKTFKDDKAFVLGGVNLATAYLKLNKVDSALYYSELTLPVAQTLKPCSEKADMYEILSQIYTHKNDKIKSKFYASLLQQTRDRYISIDQKNEVSSVTVQYENERKEGKLKLLAKENEINRLKIHEQTLELETKNLWLIAFSLVVFFLILTTGLIVYLFYLNKQKNLLELNSKAKSSMLQQLNHEIRTPLNGIVGMSQLAFESKTFVELKEYLSNIKLSSDELMFVLNNLIAFLQIDRKEAAPVSSPFDLVEGLEELFKSYEFQCKAKGLLFNQMVYPGVPRMVNGDKQKIITIIQNLLNNAVKHSTKGVVKIEVRQTAQRYKNEKNLSTIQFTVSDEGAGLNERQIKQLFKGQVKVSNKPDGFGIGLKNVKDLSDLLKGHIEVISESGVGSSFIFELEMEVLSQPSVKMNLPGSEFSKILPGKYTILVVEDNKLNQKLITKILEKQGYNYGVADNGKKALDLIKERSFDLILMDIRMPEMDGIETSYNIRSKEEYALDRDIPIIAVTAHDDSQEKKKCFDIGMNDYVTKPYNKDVLLQKIESQLSKKTMVN